MRDALELDGSGLLRRVGDMEMNAFCRRAVSQSVLLAEATGGRSVAFTMGPPSALDVLREAAVVHRSGYLRSVRTCSRNTACRLDPGGQS